MSTERPFEQPLPPEPDAVEQLLAMAHKTALRALDATIARLAREDESLSTSARRLRLIGDHAGRAAEDVLHASERFV